MTLSKKQLVVKRSSLPSSGKGLFTKVRIPAGTRIVEYQGKITTWKEANHYDGQNGYIYYVTRNHVIDALPTKNALARYANDARGMSRKKGVTNNSDYVEYGRKVYIESKKDIPPGSEILVSYGKEYWDVIRFNTKLWKKEEKEKLAKRKNGKSVKKKR